MLALKDARRAIYRFSAVAICQEKWTVGLPQSPRFLPRVWLVDERGMLIYKICTYLLNVSQHSSRSNNEAVILTVILCSMKTHDREAIYLEPSLYESASFAINM